MTTQWGSSGGGGDGGLSQSTIDEIVDSVIAGVPDSAGVQNACRNALNQASTDNVVASGADVSAVPAAVVVALDAAWGTLVTATADLSSGGASEASIISAAPGGMKHEIMEWRITNHSAFADALADVYLYQSGSPVATLVLWMPGLSAPYTRRALTPLRPLYSTSGALSISNVEGLSDIHVEIDYRVVPV